MGPRRRRDFGEPQIRRFVEPCILLALAQDPAHGYELRSRLRQSGISESSVDTGNLYRTLRLMEAAGLVESTWDTARGGPARREYSLTPLGGETLRDWARAIRGRRDDLGVFLQSYDRYVSSGDDENG